MREPWPVAEAELRIDEALALGGLEAGVASELVVPGPVRGAGCHGREDVDQARMLPARGQDGLDAGFLSELLPLNELDGQAGLARHLLGVGADLLPQRGGPLRIIEQPDVTRGQVSGER